MMKNNKIIIKSHHTPALGKQTLVKSQKHLEVDGCENNRQKRINKPAVSADVFFYHMAKSMWSPSVNASVRLDCSSWFGSLCSRHISDSLCLLVQHRTKQLQQERVCPVWWGRTEQLGDELERWLWTGLIRQLSTYFCPLRCRCYNLTFQEGFVCSSELVADERLQHVPAGQTQTFKTSVWMIRRLSSWPEISTATQQRSDHGQCPSPTCSNWGTDQQRLSADLLLERSRCRPAGGETTTISLSDAGCDWPRTDEVTCRFWTVTLS